MRDDSDCDIIATAAADLKLAVFNALSQVGCTFDELARMHETGDYETIGHRLAWVAIGDLYGVDIDALYDDADEQLSDGPPSELPPE